MASDPRDARDRTGASRTSPDAEATSTRRATSARRATSTGRSTSAVTTPVHEEAPHHDAVRRAVDDVADPELPPVTIGMLGMVHHLDVADDGSVAVELLPTFSGCPATEMIERDVVAAVRAVAGVTSVSVRFRFDPPWTPDRIDATGRDRLREFGIAPPGGPIHGAVAPEGRRSLPLALGDGPAETAPRTCPYCASTDTIKDSSFGPTPCRDVRYCSACQQPFEAFKPL